MLRQCFFCCACLLHVLAVCDNCSCLPPELTVLARCICLLPLLAARACCLCLLPVLAACACCTVLAACACCLCVPACPLEHLAPLALVSRSKNCAYARSSRNFKRIYIVCHGSTRRYRLCDSPLPFSPVHGQEHPRRRTPTRGMRLQACRDGPKPNQ